MCVACECNPQGSATQQCDRRTGWCECEPGITGEKCDQCDRGTTGNLPYCEPCGECFDNWDQIITELTGLKAFNQSINQSIISVKKCLSWPN